MIQKCIHTSFNCTMNINHTSGFSSTSDNDDTDQILKGWLPHRNTSLGARPDQRFRQRWRASSHASSNSIIFKMMKMIENPIIQNCEKVMSSKCAQALQISQKKKKQKKSCRDLPFLSNEVHQFWSSHEHHQPPSPGVFSHQQSNEQKLDLEKRTVLKMKPYTNSVFGSVD